MTATNECKTPIGISSTFELNTPEKFKLDGNFENGYDHGNINFATFDQLKDVSNQKRTNNLLEFHRHNSENCMMNRKEIFSDLKHLERTNSLNHYEPSKIPEDFHLERMKINAPEGAEAFTTDFEKAFQEPENILRQSQGVNNSNYMKDKLLGHAVKSDNSVESLRNCHQSYHQKGFNSEYNPLENYLSKDTSDLGGCTTGDDEWDSDGRPTGERWPPLGAPNDEEDNHSLYSYSEYSWNRTSNGRSCEEERLQQLEEEQEQLNNSLMALTSHFAQVQFRLKQIVDAEPNEKEKLLHDLEEFANRGIPDIRDVTVCKGRRQSESDNDCNGEDLASITRQKELIEKLKQQLEDLESYAYQTGEGGPPQAKIMEKQRVVIEQLKGTLNLNVDEFDKLTVDDLKIQVDSAVRELVNPLKMKEQLVAQLQTQIIDLERFVKFLQGETGETEVKAPKSKCACKESRQHRYPGDGRSQDSECKKGKSSSNSQSKLPKTKLEKEQLRKETEHIMKRATILLNMLSFGCGPNHASFQKNTLKKTPRGNHYGDLRASLEVAINNVLDVLGPETADSDYTSDSEETPIIPNYEVLTLTVRKQLAPALRDLIQHGLMPVGQSQSLVPFLSCFPQRSQRVQKILHAWDLILKYYQLKKGDQYNRTPARRLSQSFNLEITGGCATTNKQSLLTTIGNIIASHTPLKRSYDSHFKAFVCAGLNQKKLIAWLRLIFRTQILTENYYQPWSYVCKTGFEDAFRSLEKINKYNFDLPTDLAVRPFQNIKDAF